MTRRNDLLYNWQEVCTSLRTQIAEMLGIIQILHNVVSSSSRPELIDAEKAYSFCRSQDATLSFA